MQMEEMVVFKQLIMVTKVKDLVVAVVAERISDVIRRIDGTDLVARMVGLSRTIRRR